jgi:hypothetical protein
MEGDGKTLGEEQRHNANKLFRDVTTLRSEFPRSVRDIIKRGDVAE